MIVLDITQRSQEWLDARLGIPCSSQFSRIVTAGGKLSTQADGYMNELLAEFLTGQAEENYQNYWMKRGIELEPVARSFYEFATDIEVSIPGFIYKDDRRLTGCSPDGISENGKGGLEIKCPKAGTQIGYLLNQEVPDDYKQQIYGSLWITGAEFWDWLSYHPSLPHVLIRVYRDEKYIRALESAVNFFIEEMLRKREELIERGITRAESSVAATVQTESLL